MNALQAGAELADTLRACAAAPAERLLVVAVEAVTMLDLAGIADEAVLHRLLPGTSTSAHHPWLPFADAAFDLVVLYRVTSRHVDIQLLLGEMARVLRPNGSVLVLEHHSDFSFAPLPAAGPTHLLRGWLRQAGFTSVDYPVPGSSRLVAVAHA